MNSRIHASLVLATLLLPLFLAGCGRSESVPSAPLNQQQLVESVRSEVAKILKKEASQVEVTKPLAALGADDLDVVEIVTALEEKFKVEIPDSTLGDKPDDVGKTLTVQKLAEIVSKQPKAK
jgi:acyl carrier protein